MSALLLAYFFTWCDDLEHKTEEDLSCNDSTWRRSPGCASLSFIPRGRSNGLILSFEFKVDIEIGSTQWYRRGLYIHFLDQGRPSVPIAGERRISSFIANDFSSSWFRKTIIFAFLFRNRSDIIRELLWNIYTVKYSIILRELEEMERWVERPLSIKIFQSKTGLHLVQKDPSPMKSLFCT